MTERQHKQGTESASLKDLIFKPATERTPSQTIASDWFEWVEIPAGTVTMIGDGKGYLQNRAELSIYVDSFYITKHPITNRQYAPYVKASRQRPPYWRDGKFNHPNQPVVGVSWFNVIDYSAWLSTKLAFEVVPPIDYQWQRSAQGDTDYKYPWGNRWHQAFANTSERIGHTTAVNQFPEGASPYGVLDLAGNIWEWCYIDSHLLDEDSVASSVLCGGSYLNYEMFATVNSRNIRLPNMAYNDVGFRLVRL